MFQRICEQCKLPFSAKSRDTRFCTPKCNTKSRWIKNKKQMTAYHKKWVNENRKILIAHQIRYNHNEMKLYPWRSLIRASRKRANKAGMLHTLSFEWAEKNWTGKCAITSIEFALPSERYGRKNRNFFPSIDRIDSKKGYIPDNCRFVLWAINVFKGDGTDEDMYKIAKAIMANISRNDSPLVPV